MRESNHPPLHTYQDFIERPKENWGNNFAGKVCKNKTLSLIPKLMHKSQMF